MSLNIDPPSPNSRLLSRAGAELGIIQCDFDLVSASEGEERELGRKGKAEGSTGRRIKPKQLLQKGPTPIKGQSTVEGFTKEESLENGSLAMQLANSSLPLSRVC